MRRPSYDPIAQAFSGFMYINSPRGTKPMAVFPGIGDFITALFALWSSLAALLRARETGEGDVIDLSQYEAILRVSAQYPAEYFTKGNSWSEIRILTEMWAVSGSMSVGTAGMCTSP